MTSATTPPRIGVILVNYTGWATTVRCLRALQTLDYPSFDVIVVDNASPDDSAAQLATLQTELTFTLIANTVNSGYAGGNNVGIQHALAHGCHAAWLLNNDTIPDKDSLRALVAAWQAQGDGLYGSVLTYPDGRYQQAGIRLNRWTGQLRGYPDSRLPSGEPLPVDAIGGASLFIPKAVLDRAGLLPEEYFLYVEDVAYALQAQAAGFTSTIVAKSRIMHEEGATISGKSQQPSLMAQYYYQRNRLAVLSAHLPWFQVGTVWVYTVFRWWRLALKALLNRQRQGKSFCVFSRAMADAMMGRLGPQRV